MRPGIDGSVELTPAHVNERLYALYKGFQRFRKGLVFKWKSFVEAVVRCVSFKVCHLQYYVVKKFSIPVLG